jgi:hypothetical protein
VKTKSKRKKATRPPKGVPGNSFELRGWPAIAKFLGMPHSTVHRWAKEGMPVRRAGRNVVASPDELNRWLQRTSGEAAGVHVVAPGSDLLKDLRASVAAQKETKNPARDSKSERVKRPLVKAPKTNAARKSPAERPARVRPALSRYAYQQRVGRMLVAIGRYIRPFADGDEAMPHGKASRDRMCSSLRQEYPPAIS